MASLVAWNLTTKNGQAEEAASASEYGMLCEWPDLGNSTLYAVMGPYKIKQSNGPDQDLYVTVDISTSKIQDPPSTKPYNHCSFIGDASIKVSAPGQNKWATYWANYSVDCDPEFGTITCNVTNQPWTQKIVSILVGTTNVDVHINVINPFAIYAAGNSVTTGVSIYRSYSVGAIYVSGPVTQDVYNYFIPLLK